MEQEVLPEDLDRVYEREIQQYVAANLGVLGEGLTLIGTEHPVPFGRIDVLAVDAAFNHTVVEIKRGIATRDVVGQIQSYIGAVRHTFPDSKVTGIVVAQGIDEATKAALSISPHLRFFKYERMVSFAFAEVKPPPSQQEPFNFWKAASDGNAPTLSKPLDASAAWPMPFSETKP